MAEFKGTFQEFVHYIGTRVIKNVQVDSRKDKKKRGNKCELCGAEGKVEAAHYHGRERNDIIAEVLDSKYKQKDFFYIKDVKIALDDIREAHYPYSQTIICLCPDCHRKYDKEKDPATIAAIEKIRQKIMKANDLKTDAPEIIFINPTTYKEFHKKILQIIESKGSCKIKKVLFYKNGNQETREEKTWMAKNITADSDVVNNIKTQHEYRNWKDNGLIKVEISIVK